MPKILVAGLINIETTLQIDHFPLEYLPVRYPFFGIKSTVSGVGYNLSKALTTLGDSVTFLSLIGQDAPGMLIQQSLGLHNISQEYVVETLKETPQSVILYDPQGKRAINTDLKDIQEQPYSLEQFETALSGCNIAAICNINFARPFLSRARNAGKIIATDVHTISNIEDEYNRDFVAAAHILFQSHELLPCSPEEWAQRLQNRYGTEIVVIGLGAEGVLLAVKRDNFIGRFPAVYTRPVVNSIGAGDALFSAFIHFYAQAQDPYSSLKKAIVFASYKIGVSGGAEGFLSELQLLSIFEQISS